MQSPIKIMGKHTFTYPFLREDPYTGTHTATLQFPTGNGAAATLEVPASVHSQKRILLQNCRMRIQSFRPIQTDSNSCLKRSR